MLKMVDVVELLNFKACHKIPHIPHISLMNKANIDRIVERNNKDIVVYMTIHWHSGNLRTACHLKLIKELGEVLFFFCRWALTLPPRFDKEATSALWLTSHGAPPDCRKLTGPGWAWGSPGWFFRRT